MADQAIQIPPDSTGKKVETSELTRVDGVAVERQRVAIGDSSLIGGLVGVTPEGYMQTQGRFDEEIVELLRDIKVGIELLMNQEIKR